MYTQPRRIPLAAMPPARQNIVSLILARCRVQRSRRALARLDHDALADIGLTPEQAQIEARRSLWDAPDHWLR